MGGKASKKRSAGSTIRQSGGAAAVEPLASGDQRQPGQSSEPERVDSNTRGDNTESSEAAISSKQAVPKEVVEASNAHEVAAVTTATEKKTPCEPHDGEELIESSDGLAFREIFVQYIPGKPHALAEFGALLYTHHDRHEFMDIDGTGLARAAGLRHHDELISINNPQSDISSASQLAVLECFSDIGTQIGLVIKRKQRKQEETWLIAFHLNEKDNRPVVENIFSKIIILDSLLIPVIPVDSAFDENPVYSYDCSAQVEMILEDGDRHMEIDTDKATYVLYKEIVTLNYYETIFGTVPGLALSISTPESSDRDLDNGIDSDCDKDDSSMCIEAVDVGPLSVVSFPSYMTGPDPILQNNMFFIMAILPTGSEVFKAANTQDELYISSDEEDAMLWVASLRASSSKFRIESDGKVLKTREDFLKLFKACDS
ncbi:uncharacterized protein LOC100892317 isoform X2 [Strongylocentrotus purpuratus]|uniref:Uncharacterized protein n=1 Tax=Strongylocentrotus purpuratus TaxID=7668 RepID=A0A7M7PAY7_STRPU|nr:uncharacterized protein LOC100892317 isoform X2 [Strongylocentrotus purpuratus]